MLAGGYGGNASQPTNQPQPTKHNPTTVLECRDSTPRHLLLALRHLSTRMDEVKVLPHFTPRAITVVDSGSGIGIEQKRKMLHPDMCAALVLLV